MIGSVATYLSEGFFLGLSLGTTCAATCGPMYMPYLLQRKQTLAKSVMNIFEISAGRFLAYLAFGMVAGMIGKAIGVVVNRGWFTAVAYILFSILLLLSAFRTHKKEKGCQVSKWSKFADRPFLFGVLTGVSLCPSFFGAMTAAVDTGGAVGGASIFASFFFGSSVFLLPFAIAGVAGNKAFFRKVGVIASVVVAAYFIGKGGMTLTHLYTAGNNTQTSVESAQNIISALDEKPLYVLSDLVADNLVETLKEKKKGDVIVASETTELPEECHVLVIPGTVENPRTFLAPKRFVVVIPGVGEEGITKEYSETVVTYLNKYLFKQDTENGTFFNMESFLSRKTKIEPTTSDQVNKES